MAIRLGKRNKIQILADMLEASIDVTPSTKILGVANVTSRSFRCYLDGLVSRGFLREIEQAYSERLLYQTTQEGEDVLELVHRLRNAFGEELW